MPELIQDYLNGEDLLNLPSGHGERYELIEGELHTMAPAGNEHGLIAGTIHGEIYVYLREHPIGKVLAAETGFYTRGNTQTVRAADVTFIHSDKIPPQGLPTGFSHIVPDLVVEVVSTHDKAEEVEEKITEWLTFGVQLVWVIYPKTEKVYIYRQGQRDPTILTREDSLSGEQVLPAFTLPIRKLFES